MDEIQQLLNNTSMSLNVLENTIRKTIDTPTSNINTEYYNLINIPHNYIRTANFYRTAYNLTRLIDNREETDNIAYTLQLSDLYNYFINRFDITLSVGVLFRKQAIINIVSIQEGILKCTYNSLRRYCINDDKTVCKFNIVCDYYLKNIERKGYNQFLDMYKQVIKFYDDNIFEKLIEQKKVRDKIHIHIVDTNELNNDSYYTLEKYNEAIMVLQYIRDYLLIKVEDFKSNRHSNCRKI